MFDLSQNGLRGRRKKEEGRRKKEGRRRKEERRRKEGEKTEKKRGEKEERRRKAGFAVVGTVSSPTKSKFAARTLTFSPPGSMTS